MNTVDDGGGGERIGSKQRHRVGERRMMEQCKKHLVLREYSNTMVFKSFQIYPMVNIYFAKKKTVKSHMVGDLKRLPTVTFACSWYESECP